MIRQEQDRAIQALLTTRFLESIVPEGITPRPTTFGGDFKFKVPDPEIHGFESIDVKAHDYCHPRWLGVGWAELKFDVRYNRTGYQQTSISLELDDHPKVADWFYKTARRQQDPSYFVNHSEYQEKLFEATLSLINRANSIEIKAPNDSTREITLFDQENNTRVVLTESKNSDESLIYGAKYSPHVDKRVHQKDMPTESFYTSNVGEPSGWGHLFAAAEAKKEAVGEQQLSKQLTQYRERFIEERELEKVLPEIREKIVSEITNRAIQAEKTKPSSSIKIAAKAVRYDYETSKTFKHGEQQIMIAFELQAGLAKDDPHPKRWEPYAAVTIKEVLIDGEKIDISQIRPIGIAPDLGAELLKKTEGLRKRDRMRIALPWLPI